MFIAPELSSMQLTDHASTLSQSDQIQEHLTLLTSQRETLLAELETLEPGSAEFAALAQRLVDLKHSIANQEQALQLQLEAEKTEAESQAEAEAKHQAEQQAKVVAEASAIAAQNELLEHWENLSSELMKTIVDWQAFTQTESYQILVSLNKQALCSGSYGI